MFSLPRRSGQRQAHLLPERTASTDGDADNVSGAMIDLRLYHLPITHNSTDQSMHADNPMQTCTQHSQPNLDELWDTWEEPPDELARLWEVAAEERVRVDLYEGAAGWIAAPEPDGQLLGQGLASEVGRKWTEVHQCKLPCVRNMSLWQMRNYWCPSECVSLERHASWGAWENR